MLLPTFIEKLNEAAKLGDKHGQVILIKYPIENPKYRFATTHEIEVETVPGFIFITAAPKL